MITIKGALEVLASPLLVSKDNTLLSSNPTDGPTIGGLPCLSDAQEWTTSLKSLMGTLLVPKLQPFFSSLTKSSEESHLPG